MAGNIVEPEDTTNQATEDLVNALTASTEDTSSEQDVVETDTDEGLPLSDDDDLDGKYKGKSAAELARMHRELESKLGEQGREVGELRRAFDEMVQRSIAASNTQTTAPDSDDDDLDYYSDPKSAIAKAIANDPNVKSAQQFMQQMGRQKALETIKAKHPDMPTVLADEGFKKWVNANKVRKELYDRADQSFDIEAADLLLSDWKERQSVAKGVAKVEQAANKAEVRNASTGSSRGNNSNAPRETNYIRRRDIIELMKKDPKRYEALQPEIMRAYAEKRVIK